MDIQSLVAQLRQQASRIEQAIAALVGLGSPSPRRGRPPKASQPVRPTKPKGRTMSAAARAKIAAAQRARWAKQKGEAPTKKAATKQKKASGRKPMSAAMRKKLSAMMKARWAARKMK
jgi:outer membrane protein TolC